MTGKLWSPQATNFLGMQEHVLSWICPMRVLSIGLQQEREPGAWQLTCKGDGVPYPACVALRIIHPPAAAMREIRTQCVFHPAKTAGRQALGARTPGTAPTTGLALRARAPYRGLAERAMGTLGARYDDASMSHIRGSERIAGGRDAAAASRSSTLWTGWLYRDDFPAV